jgi:hypothetical protein
MRPLANFQTRHLIASETLLCRMEPTSAPLARRVCLGRSMSAAFFMHLESLRICASHPTPLTSTAQTAITDLPKGKRRPRASPTVDMGFCVFNGKPACCALGCGITKNAKCSAFAVPVRNYRRRCVAWDGNRGKRHDCRCLVFNGISVHDMSLLVVARRADYGTSIISSWDNCVMIERCST